MTPLLFALLALAGGAGAAARFILDGVIRSRLKTAFPWATTVINVTGSLALGVLTGLTAAHLLPEQLGLVLGAGFLGGYTTFSTASYETVQLIRQGRYGASLLSGLLMLALCVAAASLGLWLGSSV